MGQDNDLVEHISSVWHCIKLPLAISYVNLNSYIAHMNAMNACSMKMLYFTFSLLFTTQPPKTVLKLEMK